MKGQGAGMGGECHPPRGKVQERPQEGAACPDLLENEGETVTNPRSSQIYVTPRGLKHPTPEGREKI